MRLWKSVSVVVLALFPTVLSAQHAGDIELGYDSLTTPSALLFETLGVTQDGIAWFESEMEELDPFNPGDFPLG